MRTCDRCGAALDPQEICDCYQEPPAEISLRCVSPPVIAENLASITGYIADTLAHLAALPRDKEGCAAAKSLRADLRRRFASLEEQRKAVKQQVMAPYLAAEAVYKEKISTPFDDADKQLKDWIDSYQDEIKQACRRELEDYFHELCDFLHIDFVTFDRTGVVVDMATAQQKDPRKARAAIHDFLIRIDEDRQTIATMPNAEEILAEYRQSLSLSAAIAAFNDRRSRADESAAELESLRQRQAKAADTRHSLYIDAPEIVPQEETYCVTFTVTGTIAQLRALKAFLESNQFTFQEDHQ